MRHLLVGEEARDLIPPQGNDAIEQCHVDVLAATGDRAVLERGQYGDRRVHPGHDIGDRNSGLLRAATRQCVCLAGDAHQSADGLEHEVVAGLVCARTVLAIAGDRAVHQPGIQGAEAFIVQPVASKVADLVVLDHDIADLHQLSHERLPFGARQVDRDGSLPAIGGRVVRGVGSASRPILALNPGRPPSARIVANPRALHFDHFGAHVREIL
ncbi:hypothetical protein D3C87_1512170 [compost metagenome]